VNVKMLAHFIERKGKEGLFLIRRVYYLILYKAANHGMMIVQILRDDDTLSLFDNINLNPFANWTK